MGGNSLVAKPLTSDAHIHRSLFVANFRLVFNFDCLFIRSFLIGLLQKLVLNGVLLYIRLRVIYAAAQPEAHIPEAHLSINLSTRQHRLVSYNTV